VVQYAVGDFVYLQREMVDTLDTRAGARILPVKEVAPNGVLEGSDARTVQVHKERCAPCHQVNSIDARMDPRVAVPPANFACTRCRKASGAARMLFGNGCGAGWHLDCLAAPLAAMPEVIGTVTCAGRDMQRRRWPSCQPRSSGSLWNPEGDGQCGWHVKKLVMDRD
jgi:hypothetical protein